MGKHSWRSTGAVWFTLIGIAVAKIQLLARWDSELVTHYTRLAPIANIGQETRRAVRKKDQKSKDRGRPLKAVMDKEVIRAAVDKHSDIWRVELLKLEKRIRKAEESSKPKEYVRNTRTKVIHRVCTTYEEAGRDAVTMCSWEYVLGLSQPWKTAPQTKRECCGSCMSALRITLSG